MGDYLADTSIFIAAECGRELGEAPEGKARISVATLMELNLGVRSAADPPTRDLREATLAKARSFVAIPYDEPVAEELAVLVHAAREQRRRARAEDAIIAATALVHDLVVWSQDDDFEVLSELEPRLRVHRC
ncbi:MAG: PIN domain-containing protein [Solirubrobacterales bacterium]